MDANLVTIIVCFLVPTYFIVRGLMDLLACKKGLMVDAVVSKIDRKMNQWQFIRGNRLLPTYSYEWNGEKKTFSSDLKTEEKVGDHTKLYIDASGEVIENRRAKINLYTGIVLMIVFVGLKIYNC